MSKAMFNVVRRLSMYSRPVEKTRIMEEVLRESKRKREGLTKEEIVAKGFDIYEKRGISVSELINDAIKQGLAECIAWNKAVDAIRISDKGVHYLISVYTNDGSDDFIQFERELDEKTKELGELPLEKRHIASLFWSGKTVEQICEQYFTMSYYEKSIQGYHEHLLQLFGVETTEGKKIFHFHPKLFLPVAWMDEEISLEIEGIDTPENMILTKPYPNKRYVVAGIKVGKEKTSAGFYPIVANPEEFPETLDIRLTWTVGNRLIVVHHLYISFEMKDHKGNLFSTMQHIGRNSNLDSFNLSTFIEMDEDLWIDRYPSFFFSDKYGELIIEEIVTLTNFPIHLHSTFYADTHFQKWMETKE